MLPLIEREDEVTAEWLAEALALEGVRDVVVAPIGTGQMSRSLRASFRADDGERSVVVKIPSGDPTSRATGVGLGAYAREIAFYRELGPAMANAVPVCHAARHRPEDGSFTLVLEDAAPARQGDQIAGCTIEQARLALTALAGVHAPVLGDVVLGGAEWLNQPNPLTQQLYGQLLPAFMARYADRLAPEHAAVLEAFADRVDAWVADRRAPLGLVHGDFRLDNLLFDAERCVIVDWQTVGWGPPMLDVSYFLGGSLTVADRRAHEEDLVHAYHDALTAAGGRALTWERCWEEYRRQAFAGILMAVAAAMVVEQTERGDEMFTVLVARHAQQIIDLEALSLLPEGGGAPVAALRPEAVDEGLHEPGPEPLWNESLYFDAVSDDGRLGVYLRIGRVPNQNACVYAVCVCGPGRPSVMLTLDDGPLPDPADPEQRLDAPTLHATHDCEQPLQRYRVALSGTAGAHDDASAPLRGEAGEPLAIALELTWETDGIPYAWRQATRYEIPCRVTGTLRLGDEELTFAGPGQRDHSWGVRDWWAVDWMWSAVHLEDGTHVHAVGVPGMPIGVGYVQHGEEIAELGQVDAAQTFTEQGLVAAATIDLGPPALRLEVEPVAFGALLLRSPDGRVSHFPRAMCRITTDDGRRGAGWVEWNLVQRPSDGHGATPPPTPPAAEPPTAAPHPRRPPPTPSRTGRRTPP